MLLSSGVPPVRRAWLAFFYRHFIFNIANLYPSIKHKIKTVKYVLESSTWAVLACRAQNKGCYIYEQSSDIIIVVLSSHVSYSLVRLILRQWRSSPLRLQVSACSTFLMTCDVPSTAVYCVDNLLNVSWYCFQIFFKFLFIISVAPMITGMTKHFFTIVAKFIYLDFYISSYSQPHFVLSYLLVMLYQSKSRFCPFCF
jgi:hypothetical protein